MIDLSFLTDAEQEAILKVLQRDAELKKAEEQRVRHLQDEVNDENELKYKSGQWFYDAKSKRHRDKIHGADLVRASIRKRKNPTTLAELSQSGKDKSKRRWVNSINQDLFIPPELYGVMESPDETEEDLKLSMAETNQSAKRLNVASKDTDKGVMKNGTASPAKQRKNPFNSEGSVDEIDLSNGMPDQSLGGDQVNGQVGKKSDIMSSIKKLGVKLPYPSPVGSRRSSQEAKEDSLSQQPPVPKPRKLLINGQPPDRSNSSLQREDSFNNTNKPKGILKRRSSSSSTDSESIRISQTIEPIKLVLPASPILEAEQTNLFDDQITSSENSPDRQKQVRFSENVHQKPPTPNPESYNLREIGEFGILEPVSYQNELDAEFVDHPLEESRPNRYPYSDVDYDNSTEVLNQLSSLQQNRALTLQTHPNSKALDIEKKQEDQSKRIHNGISEILHESYPELNIDSAGTEPLYAVVKKPTSSDQEKDKKPDTSELSNSKKDQSKPNSQKGDTLGPIENSFPENAEKFKRMSQSVPTFLQDDTDGRDTDSASESSFQIGRHKKSPSSLTNLSGSSGMASMSSVSGSVMSMYSGDFGNVDIKGGIEFSIDYVEQLKEFHIYIYQCKDLAAAEVKKQRSDPYVKAYLLPEKAKMGKRKSAVKKKTLNPVYNEILRYKIPKESLETQTLNLSVWHHDVLGRNSFLGEVNLNLATWDWNNTQRNWYQLEARTPASGIGLENRGEMKLSLMYIPMSPPEVSKKPTKTGEVHIMIRECIQLPMLRENKINSFVKCTILPDTSRKSRQKTRTVDKTPNPIFNHTMVYDGFKEEDLREACVELTVWDHNKLSNHFLGGIRIGLGTGKSYGTAVDWMDSSPEESTMWEKMIASPNTWIEGMLPLRMFKMAKLNK
ncbi:synaptotagmin-like protein 2 isoform X15 [Hyla sarda]|uniref:synaptotagmin-like protein 2 isoform X15 n=1 Tax=Hyla sarda TaxID=327740 RepID=UPI0024C43EA6|nr:synaptotagmin-like protein 2 isoform X15 [Hyla sarda]